VTEKELAEVEERARDYAERADIPALVAEIRKLRGAMRQLLAVSEFPAMPSDACAACPTARDGGCREPHDADCPWWVATEAAKAALGGASGGERKDTNGPQELRLIEATSNFLYDLSPLQHERFSQIVGMIRSEEREQFKAILSEASSLSASSRAGTLGWIQERVENMGKYAGLR